MRLLEGVGEEERHLDSLAGIPEVNHMQSASAVKCLVSLTAGRTRRPLVTLTEAGTGGGTQPETISVNRRHYTAGGGGLCRV